MALRLIELIVPEARGKEMLHSLQEQPLLECRQIALSNGEAMVRILLNAEQSEAVLERLEKSVRSDPANRILVLPVEATLPRPEPEPAAASENPVQVQPTPEPTDRISREELYEDIRDAARCSRVYLGMVVLSSVVATIGLHHNNVAIVIGAMVIAPLLGPNVALALATTLGDYALARRALIAGTTGMAAATLLSLIVGALVEVNPALSEVAARTRVNLGDIALALASGCSAALAFTTGLSATLIGVMVAVALLPPLVTFGLLLGGGYPGPAWGALLLFLVNLICVNLSSVVTFVARGIRPATWWEKNRARKATRCAILWWALLLAALVATILLSRRI